MSGLGPIGDSSVPFSSRCTALPKDTPRKSVRRKHGRCSCAASYTSAASADRSSPLSGVPARSVGSMPATPTSLAVSAGVRLVSTLDRVAMESLELEAAAWHRCGHSEPRRRLSFATRASCPLGQSWTPLDGTRRRQSVRAMTWRPHDCARLVVVIS